MLGCSVGGNKELQFSVIRRGANEVLCMWQLTLDVRDGFTGDMTLRIWERMFCKGTRKEGLLIGNTAYGNHRIVKEVYFRRWYKFDVILEWSEDKGKLGIIIQARLYNINNKLFLEFLIIFLQWFCDFYYVGDYHCYHKIVYFLSNTRTCSKGEIETWCLQIVN